MTGRYIVRPQDDYFNVTDTCNNVPIVNGIRTEIEAEWLCNTLNELEGENKVLKKGNRYFYDEHKRVVDEYQNKIKKLENENQELKERIKNYPICYTCKYCFRDDWYGVCCENEDCPHYTRYWELELQTECKHYELKEEEDDEDDY